MTTGSTEAARGRPKIHARDVIARMDPDDAKRVLGELAAYIETQKVLNVQRSVEQAALTKTGEPPATLSQREQAGRRAVAHHVAAVAHDIDLQHLIMIGLQANARRDREVLGEQPRERPVKP